jgi:chromosome partitioning protein
LIDNLIGNIAGDKPMPRAHVIVIGNEKGGSGKTTTAMHLIVALLRLGFSVGTLDVDSRQRSLTRYLENRKNTMLKKSLALPLPHHEALDRSTLPLVADADEEERICFTNIITKMMQDNDFVVVDSPGSDANLSRVAHSFADTVITPINDSFIDLDVIAQVDPDSLKVKRPSIYAEMVFKQKMQKLTRDGKALDWIVMRNRLSNIDARNKRNIETAMVDLSKRISFRVAPGFSERVIFRELFLEGMTVLDVIEKEAGINLTLSHVSARQEVRKLLKTLEIPAVDAAIEANVGAGKKEFESETAEDETSESGDSSPASRVSPVLASALSSSSKPVNTSASRYIAS